MRRIAKIFQAVCTVLALSVFCYAQEEASVPVPDSEPDYHCPVGKRAAIIQGNDQLPTHNSDWLRYSWDYSETIGAPVVAARGGIVTEVLMKSNIGMSDPNYDKYANKVVIRHSDGSYAIYLHLKKDSNFVQVGEFVLQGEVIALLGDTGMTNDAHLHFHVYKGSKSIPITFSDFKNNGGVPNRGSIHGPASPPKVPQKVITSYKACFRAVIAAQKLSFPDIALALLEKKMPRSSKYSSYYYNKVLKARRKRLLEEIQASAERLIQQNRPSVADAFLMKRYLVALRDTKDAKDLVRKLAKKIESLSTERKKALTKLSSPLRKVLDAIQLECGGELLRAVRAYAIAVRKSTGALKDFLLENAKRAFEAERKKLIAEVSHLREESDRCPPSQRHRVRKDLNTALGEAKAFAKTWKSAFPEEKDSVQQMLRSLEEEYEYASKKLK